MSSTLEETIIQLEARLGTTSYFKVKRADGNWLAQVRVYIRKGERIEYAGYAETISGAFDDLISVLEGAGAL